MTMAPQLNLNLQLPITVSRAAYDYGQRADGGTHGVVLTKPHVVDLILDLAGYTSKKNLAEFKILEPSCGEGAFLVPAVERLLTSAQRHGVDPATLAHCVRAYDIDAGHVTLTKTRVLEVLRGRGVPPKVSALLVESWILRGDFLLAPESHHYDAIVGNPPYVRIEQISPELQVEYRRRYRSLYDRADLYVAFIERCLELLSKTGILSLICADRWTSNKYGAPLRCIVAENFAVLCYIDLHTASPFESEVIAYPSIFAIRRGRSAGVNVVRLATASESECAAVIPTLENGTPAQGVTCDRYENWFQQDEPWVTSSPAHLAALRELESRYDTLEADGMTKVGIGVASGCDKVFIVGEDSGIEAERLVPLVMREDINRGKINDAKRYVINMFREDGKVIELREFPHLLNYVTQHKAEIARRHVAQKNPSSWFRTIDRVYPELVSRPKLLIPDIAGSNEVAYDKGRFHPHHNLYFITSQSWDLEVLGGLLSSRVALFFVWSYAVRMRGGYLRFQAQYLRKIRVPPPGSIGVVMQEAIREAFRRRDFETLDRLALEAYKLRELPSFDFVDTRK